jgi:hypothetical protein
MLAGGRRRTLSFAVARLTLAVLVALLLSATGCADAREGSGDETISAAQPRANGPLSTADEAAEAARRLLPADVASWEVMTVTLVEKESELLAVAPQFPAEGLSPKGFPGPVWIVDLIVSLEGEHQGSAEYVFEASSGKPLKVSGQRFLFGSCVEPPCDDLAPS